MPGLRLAGESEVSFRGVHCSLILQGAGATDQPYRADGHEFGAGLCRQNDPAQVGTTATEDNRYAQQGPASCSSPAMSSNLVKSKEPMASRRNKK